MSGEQRAALVAIYSSLLGSGWQNSNGWLGPTPPCTWYGISCDNSSSITTLNVTLNSVAGTLPTEIGLIGQLGQLFIDSNPISGSLPTQIGGLSRLTSTTFMDTSIHGTLPTQLGRLKRLRKLAGEPWTGRQFNLVAFPVSGTLPSQLATLTNFEYLDFGTCACAEAMNPVRVARRQTRESAARPHGTSSWDALTNAACASRLAASISGTLPAHLEWYPLITLQMYDSRLSGTMPTELCNFSGLNYLQFGNTLPMIMEEGNFYNRSISGTIPSCIGNIHSLNNIEVTHAAQNRAWDMRPHMLFTACPLRGRPCSAQSAQTAHSAHCTPHARRCCDSSSPHSSAARSPTRSRTSSASRKYTSTLATSVAPSLARSPSWAGCASSTSATTT
jgi:hypothetical protein